MTLRKKTLIKLLLLILIMALGSAIYYVSSIYRGLESLNKTSENSPFSEINEAVAVEPPEWLGTEPVNILLMGVDARGTKKGEIPRSDSMMVVSLDPTQKSIHVFSILRDTYTDIAGHGKNRINTAIQHGPQVAMSTVGELLGMPVQYYVYTDFQGFIQLVDAVGGVDFHIEKDMNYESKADKHEFDINLKEGMQHLNGTTALQYVRFRHDAMSDFSRTQRQRDFLKAIAEEMKTTTSIMKLPSILKEVSPYIDTNLSVDDMWKLASLGYQSNVTASEQIPPMKLIEQTYVGRAAVLSVTSKSDLRAFVQDVLHTSEPDSVVDEAGVDQASTSVGK